jgi:hypothetical protein
VTSRRDVLRGGISSGLLLAAPRAMASVDPAAVRSAKEKLIVAYPRFLAYADETGIVWRDGTRFPWSDGRADKTFDERLADASLADQMSLPYRRGPIAGPPAFDDDPGRFRNTAFFRKIYGADESAVRANLTSVPWRIGTFRGELPFTKVNGVDVLAAQIVDELAALPESFARYVTPPAGSFNWRQVAGTAQLSPHAFGIAVDINVALSRYWRWDKHLEWRNEIPFEIVDIFERHGFIWGGKWYHYDTMHFEYRPELTARD